MTENHAGQDDEPGDTPIFHDVVQLLAGRGDISGPDEDDRNDHPPTGASA